MQSISDDDKLRDKFSRLGSAALRACLAEFGEYKVSRIVRSFTRGRTSVPGEPPGIRAGLLRASILYVVEATNVLIVGTNRVYAAMLQFGGIIRPKHARALTIPIAPEAEGKRARDFENTFILRRADTPYSQFSSPKRMSPTVFQSEASDKMIGTIMQTQPDGTAKPLFALRTSVTITPRPYMFWDERDERKLRGILDRAWEAT